MTIPIFPKRPVCGFATPQVCRTIAPLSHAQAIKTGRVRSIGLVLQVSEHDGHRPFLANFLAGITEGAALHDWTLTLATASSTSDTIRLLEKLSQERKADGSFYREPMLKIYALMRCATAMFLLSFMGAPPI